MKDKYIRLKAMLLAGAIAISGVSLTGCSSSEYYGNELIISQSTQDSVKKVFGAGEHIISVPIKTPIDEIKQYNYHAGYKVVGISAASQAYAFYGACILYENEYPVECYSTGVDKNGIVEYKNFGQPIDFEIEDANKTSSTKDFNPGEHILSVPIKNPIESVMQYDHHDGYEVVGIAAAAQAYAFDGACILYVNNNPVTCTLTEIKDNQELYLSFGVPIEKGKTKVLD